MAEDARSADLALQGFVASTLVDAVSAVDGRVFDRVSPDAVFPYLSLSGWQVVDDGAECIAAVEIYFDVHVWSRAVGRVEASIISAAIAAALNRAEPDLPGYGLVAIGYRDTQFFVDPDGLTQHAVVRFRALIDTP